MNWRSHFRIAGRKITDMRLFLNDSKSYHGNLKFLSLAFVGGHISSENTEIGPHNPAFVVLRFDSRDRRSRTFV